MFSPPMSAAGMKSNKNAKMRAANLKHTPARTHLSRNHYRRGRSLGIPTVSDEAPSAARSIQESHISKSQLASTDAKHKISHLQNAKVIDLNKSLMLKAHLQATTNKEQLEKEKQDKNEYEKL